MHVVPLGISAAIPAHGRHLSATALDLGGEWILFDCGEGTQYQIMKTALRPSRLSTICITHLHGDHVFGLPGLLTSLSMNGRRESLRLVGPAGLFEALYAWPGVQGLGFEIDEVPLSEPLRVSLVVNTPTHRIAARPLDHRVFCAGYRWEEKAGPGNLDVEKARALGVTEWPDFRQLKAGVAVDVGGRRIEPAEVMIPPARPRTFAYLTDTRPCEGGRLLAQKADLVVHDSTFTHDQAVRAVETGHSTAREAAEVARAADARRLLLTHFSARYETPEPLVGEARAVFPATDAATECAPVRLGADG